jgi:hypothetical protein
MYMSRLSQMSVTLYFVTVDFVRFSPKTAGFFPLNSRNQLILVMVSFGVLFEVRTEFLYII